MRKSRREETKGLIKLRRVTDKQPNFACDNCGCRRYSFCTCKKANK